MDGFLTFQSEMYKSLANPHRLAIVNVLKTEEVNATRLAEMLKISKANLSQHMSVLVSRGIVTARKEGSNVYYRLSGKLVKQACSIMEELAIETAKREQDRINRAF